MKKRTFPQEFKKESVSLVVDQGYTDACKAVGVSDSAMRKWVKQLKAERGGETPIGSKALTPEHQESQALKAKIKRIEREAESLGIDARTKSSRTKNKLLSYNALILKRNNGVTDGVRTHDHRNHNPGLYQLSYSHHKEAIIAMTRRAKRHRGPSIFIKINNLDNTLPFPAKPKQARRRRIIHTLKPERKGIFLL